MNIKLNKCYKVAKETKARYRILYGGAGSGKSYYVAQEIIINMLSRKDYRYLVVRKVGRTLRNSTFQLIVNLIKEYGLTDKFKINKTELAIECVTGSTLIHSGLDDSEKLKSIAGINRCWVEEASELSIQDFQQLDLRLRGKNELGYQFTLTFNPISELHWLKNYFFDNKKDDAFVLKTTYLDNTHLDEDYKRKIARLEDEDYQYYRIYALGEWGSIGNLVFSNWETQDIDVRTFDNYFNGVDWGFSSDPFAFIRSHYDKKHRIIYIVRDISQTELSNIDSAELIKPIIGRELVTCDSSEPKSVNDYKQYGINAVGAKKGQGSVEHGIKWLKSHKIIIDSSCIDTIKEFGSYKWKEDKSGNIIPQPVDAFNHLIVALRYSYESEMTHKENWGF